MNLTYTIPPCMLEYAHLHNLSVGIHFCDLRNDFSEWCLSLQSIVDVFHFFEIPLFDFFP